MNTKTQQHLLAWQASIACYSVPLSLGAGKATLIDKVVFRVFGEP
jgi:hypothetical protein